MTNDLTTTKNGALANTDFANPFAAAGAGAGSTIYAKFKGASGEYLAGQDEEEIPHGTLLAADIMNSQWSWQFWWENELLESEDSLIWDNPKGYEEKSRPDWLPEKYDGDMSYEEIVEAQKDRTTNFQDGWGVQAVVGMREINGEGREFTFRFNNGVALNAFRALLQSYGRQFQMKPGQLPLVELDANSFKSKQKGVGKRFAPKLKIVDWKTEEELMESVSDTVEDYDEVEEEKPTETPSASKPQDTSARGRRGRANYG